MDTKITMGANRPPRTVPEAEVDVSLIKILSLALFAALSAFAFGYCLRSYLTNGSVQVLAVAVAAAILFAAIFLLQTIAVKDGWRASLFTALQGAALAAWFYSTEHPAVFFAFAVTAALVLIYGGMRGRASLANMLRIHFYELGGIVVPKVILALAIITGMSLYLLRLENNEVTVSKKIFDKTFSIAREFVPGLSGLPNGASLEDDLRMAAIAQAEKQITGFSALSQSERDRVVQAGVYAMELQLSSILGSNVDFKQPMSEAVYQSVLHKISSLSPSARYALPAIFAAAVFLGILGLSLPIGWAVLFVSYLLFEILLMAGFMTRTLEERSREIVVLK